MLLLKRMGLRTFQTAFRAALPVLPYREPQALRSCARLGDVFQKENISAVPNDEKGIGAILLYQIADWSVDT